MIHFFIAYPVFPILPISRFSLMEQEKQRDIHFCDKKVFKSMEKCTKIPAQMLLSLRHTNYTEILGSLSYGQTVCYLLLEGTTIQHNTIFRWESPDVLLLFICELPLLLFGTWPNDSTLIPSISIKFKPILVFIN